jgi:hypothetical protein
LPAPFSPISACTVAGPQLEIDVVQHLDRTEGLASALAFEDRFAPLALRSRIVRVGLPPNPTQRRGVTTTV